MSNQLALGFDHALLPGPTPMRPGCRFPEYKPGSAYQYGCRCPGCVDDRRAVMARYRKGGPRTCNVAGCNELVAPRLHARRCDEHDTPPGTGPAPVSLVITCCACGDVFTRIPSQRPKYDVCTSCRLKAKSLINRASSLGLGSDVVHRLLPQALAGCAVCGAQLRLDAAQGKGSFAIDHDHSISELQTPQSIRGVVCLPCNTALGGLDRFQRLGLLDKAVAFTGSAGRPYQE